MLRNTEGKAQVFVKLNLNDDDDDNKENLEQKREETEIKYW